MPPLLLCVYIDLINTQQIYLSKIDFWMRTISFNDMQLKHDLKIYPPNVKMTISHTSVRPIIRKIPVKITGCSKEGELDMEIPLGI